MNKIIIHAYHFIKLYILSKHQIDKSIPIIDKELVVRIIKTFSKRSNRGRKFQNEDQMDDINKFHEMFYKDYMHEKNELCYTGLSQLIDYQATSIITAFHNHIQQHFYSFINRLVNIYYKKNEIVEKYINKNEKDKLKIFLDDLKELKDDLFKNTNNALKKYDKFKKIFKTEIINGFVIEKSFENMLDQDPLSLMTALINMSLYSEKLGLLLQKKENIGKPIKIITAFPLAKSCIPRYIELDSKLISLNLIGKKSGEYCNKLSNNFKNIWGEIFKMRSGIFRKKGYKFLRTMSTDGISCSILFIREDKFNATKKCMVKYMKKPSCYSEFEYLEYIDEETRKTLSKMMLLGIDPGKIELIHATDGKIIEYTKPNGKTFRKTKEFSYTQKQADHETRSDIYTKRKLEFRKNSIIKINNEDTLTIIQLENKLSKYNSASCVLSNTFSYIILKNIINSMTIEHYKNTIYRNLKWYSFINRQKSEHKLIKNFKDKYGDPKEICLIWGDFAENGNYMKGLKSSKGIGMKRIFRKAGYKIYMVNEAYTSKYLYKDGRELVQCRCTRTPLALKMLTRKNTGPSNTAQNYDSWKSESPEIISRDLNGALNILLKGNCIIKGIEIPKYLKPRKKKNKNSSV
jgi:hypothetical protein